MAFTVKAGSSLAHRCYWGSLGMIGQLHPEKNKGHMTEEEE